MDVDALRAQTPGCADRVHLNNAGAALMTRPTLDAMTSHLRLEAEIGGYEAAAAAQDQVDATYVAIAELLGGHRDEVALFDNSTHAWNAAFYSIPLGPGDRILTGRAEYGSNVLAYLQVAQRTGAEVVVVPDDDYGQLDVAALAELIDERTRLVGVSHVPTSGGLVNPAAEIGLIARDAGALFLLDATQSVGQLPVDVDEIGCDMLTGTGRKFLRGPRGTGFLWVRATALGRLDPFVAEIRSATWDGGRGFRWVDGARRFESWENSYVNVLGLGAAVRQALDLGLDAIGERARTLGARLRDRARRPVRRDDPRPRTDAVCHRHRARRRHAGRGRRRRPRRRERQRHHHGRRALPVRHRGPRRAPARAAVPALLQHRGRDRPDRRARRRPDALTVRLSSLRNASSPWCSRPGVRHPSREQRDHVPPRPVPAAARDVHGPLTEDERDAVRHHDAVAVGDVAATVGQQPRPDPTDLRAAARCRQPLRDEDPRDLEQASQRRRIAQDERVLQQGVELLGGPGARRHVRT